MCVCECVCACMRAFVEVNVLLSALLPQCLEFEAYVRYAENYLGAKTRLEELVDHPDVVQYFKSQPTKLLKEAMKYILPKSLDEPCYHCFHYFDALDVRSQYCTAGLIIIIYRSIAQIIITLLHSQLGHT